MAHKFLVRTLLFVLTLTLTVVGSPAQARTADPRPGAPAAGERQAELQSALRSATHKADMALARDSVATEAAPRGEFSPTLPAVTLSSAHADLTVSVSVEGASAPGTGPARLDDLTLYPDVLPAASIAMQPTSSGVRIMAVAHNAEAPTSYRFALGLPVGSQLHQLPSGGVVITDGSGRPLGAVAPPWAQDAAGRALPTSYRVVDNVLVQHVEHSGAAYPVVADPEIRLGWTSATIRLNARDQRIILSGGGAAAGALIGGLGCGAMGPQSLLCGAVGAFVGTMVFEAVKEYGVREHCTWNVRLGYFPPGQVLAQWPSCR